MKLAIRVFRIVKKIDADRYRGMFIVITKIIEDIIVGRSESIITPSEKREKKKQKKLNKLKQGKIQDVKIERKLHRS